MSRSVARSERFRMSTSDWTPPALLKSDCWMTVDSLRSRIVSTCSITSGEVRSIFAMRCATSRCSSSGSALSTMAAASGCMCASTERDRLRVLVLQVRQHLAGVGTAEELERRGDQRHAEVHEDLLGLVGAVARFEQLARGVVAALRDVRPGDERLAELGEDLLDRARLRGSDSRATSAMISDTSCSRRARRTGAARSLPTCMIRMAAFWTPEYFATRYDLRSASHERRVCATSSGWRSMRSVRSDSMLERGASSAGRRCLRTIGQLVRSLVGGVEPVGEQVGGFEFAQVERDPHRRGDRGRPLHAAPGEEQDREHDQQHDDRADRVQEEVLRLRGVGGLRLGLLRLLDRRVERHEVHDRLSRRASC